MNTLSVYAISWTGMVILAVLNGTVREKVYRLYMTELSAHQLSTLILFILFGVYIWILTGMYQIESSSQAFVIGGVWVSLTIVFEFIFGHFVMGHTWGTLLQDYNLRKGRIWLLILIWVTVAPYVFYRVRP
ncbi:MAG: hypothetical protein M0P57_14880 [Syntrophales bacterium]|jgi:hypothetical protein|nr:hypothetical protein [Syntrophales bacterium]MDY0043599.1 hypothetical protein [Syntrophales bacterium]